MAGEWRRDDLPLCPNLLGSELAPATAKRGLEKKVFSAPSMVVAFEQWRWRFILLRFIGSGMVADDPRWCQHLTKHRLSDRPVSARIVELYFSFK